MLRLLRYTELLLYLPSEVEGIGVKKSYGPINNALYCCREKGMASDLRGLIHCLLLSFFADADIIN